MQKRYSSPQSMRGFLHRPRPEASYKQDLELSRPILINSLVSETSRNILLHRLINGSGFVEDKSSIKTIVNNYLSKYPIPTEMLMDGIKKISELNKELERKWAFSDKACSKNNKKFKERLRDEHWFDYFFG